MKYYRSTMEAINEHSPTARVFVLIHKMDLIPMEKRDEIMEKKRKEVVRNSCDL